MIQATALQALNWTQRRSLRPDLPGWSAVEVAGYWATSASISQRLSPVGGQAR